MRLSVGEFMRRFLLHVLPNGFHRIRHYGLFANGHRADKLALCQTCSTCHLRRCIATTMTTMTPPFPTTNRPRALAAEAA